MKSILRCVSRLLPLAATALMATVVPTRSDAQSPGVLTPLALTGYTQDEIASSPGTVSSTDESIDKDFVYFARGYLASAPGLGLPAGTTFTSAANANVTFAIQPADSKNTLLLTDQSSGVFTGTLTLTTPARFTTLAVLVTGLDSSNPVSYTLTFNDSQPPTTGSFSAPDNVVGSGPEAIYGFGRVFRDNGNLDKTGDIGANNPQLYEIDLPLSSTDAARTLTGITFVNLSPGPSDNAQRKVAVFGISGLAANTAAAGEVAFDEGGYTVARASKQATVTVLRNAGDAGPLSVNYQTLPGVGSAVGGIDYQAASGTLSWADGEGGPLQPRTFTVPIITTASTPGDVDLVVALDAVDGADTLGAPSLATVQILDAADSATPIQAVDILSPPAGLTVVQNQELNFAIQVAAIQDSPFVVVGTITDDSDTTVATATLGSFAGPGGSLSWTAGAPGTYHFNAVATASNGQVVTSPAPSDPPLTITVMPAANAFDLGPQVALQGSLNGRQFAVDEQISLVAYGVDLYGNALSSVQFYANDQLLGAALAVSAAPPPPGGKTRRDSPVFGSAFAQLLVTLTPELQQLLGSQGAALITAVGTDGRGVSAVSKPAMVYPQAGHTTGLTCAITSPTDGSDLDADSSTQQVTVAANNSDGTVTQVELFSDDQSMGVLDAGPYTFTLKPLSKGLHVLSAVATDANAVSETSAPVLVLATPGGLPAVSIASLGDGTAVEGGAKAKVAISRTGDTGAPLTVYYKAKGSAVPDVDYKKLSGSVTIPAGSATAKIKIKPLDDTTLDGTLKIKIRLLAPTDNSYVLGDAIAAKIKVTGGD